MSLDLLGPLRSGVIGASGVAALLAQWKSEPAVFTRRPVPDDAPDPSVLIQGPVGLTDLDALNAPRPIADYDLLVYGSKGAPGSDEDQTRVIEQIAFLLRTHFHRNKFSFTPTGFGVIDVRVRGPFIAPTDDEQTVGRVLSLTIRLRRE